MNKMFNRILGVELFNIKNVDHGYINFCDESKVLKQQSSVCSSISGIYGQNGTGKTTVVDVFSLLKVLILGQTIFAFEKKEEQLIRIPGKFDYLINIGKNSGKIIFYFLIMHKNLPYKINFEVVLKRKGDFSRISKEIISVSVLSENGQKATKNYPPIEYDYDDLSKLKFYDGVKHRTNLTSTQIISGNLVDNIIKLQSQLLSCVRNGISMMFSDFNRNFLMSQSKEVVKLIGTLINKLGAQIFSNLFIYKRTDDALDEIGLGSLLGVYKKQNEEIHGSFKLALSPFYVKSANLDFYDRFLEEVKIFISAFVPDFYLKKEILGKKTEGNCEYTKIGIYRDINGKNLPISEESAGIRKLFLLSCAFAYSYGNENGWLIVDEFDSGVFENLLGQLTEVFERGGKGQFIFTAHNLTPLERLDYKNIVFTTSNPEHRFIKFGAIHQSNNLRDLYFRVINLGNNGEELSTRVDTEILDNALYNAYKVII